MINSGSEFWVNEGQRVIGSLDISEDQTFVLKLNDFIVPPTQVSRSDDSFTYSADPKKIVADYQPRTIFGVLSDGSLVSLLDAHMVPGPTMWFHFQEFTGQRRIVGAHLCDDFSTVGGIRWAWNVVPSALVGPTGASAAVEGALPGSLDTWAHEGPDGRRGGLEFRPQVPVPLRDLLQYVQSAATQLIGLWNGLHREPQVVLTEVLVGDKWCRYEVKKSGDTSRLRTQLLPLNELSAATFAAWIPFARSIDPFPYIANAGLNNLQVGAQMLATALEGLHRRLYPAERPFAGLPNRAVQRAMDKARRAGLAALGEEGFVDSELASKRLRDSLNHVNQPTYFERVFRLATDVAEIAPGLCAPGVTEWVSRITRIRNDQSHQLLEEFQEVHIAEYHVTVLTARWVLSLRILFELVDRSRLGAALQESEAFRFMLANADAERLWEDYSALETFQSRAGQENK